MAEVSFDGEPRASSASRTVVAALYYDVMDSYIVECGRLFTISLMINELKALYTLSGRRRSDILHTSAPTLLSLEVSLL